MARRAGLVLVAILALMAARPAGAFVDLTAHWARQEVEVLWARGLVEGMPGAAYEPDRPVTRAEVIKLLVASIEGHEDARLLAPLASSFSDLGPGHWANGYVESAYERGLALGYGDGTFRPERTLTRAEMAVLLVRVGGWEPEALARDPGAARRLLPFGDAGAVPAWAAGHVVAAVERGLLGGYPDGTFRPGEHTTRAEAAAMIARLLRRQGRIYDLQGELRTVDGWRLTVATAGGLQALASGPRTVFYRQGIRAGVADLRPLDEVRGILSPAGELLYLEAVLHDARGRLAWTNTGSGTLGLYLYGRPDEVTLSVGEQTVLVRNGAVARLGDFRPGDELYLMLGVFATEVRLVWGAQVDLEGVVERVDPERRQLEVRLAGGSRRSLPVAAGVTVLIDGVPSAWEKLRRGDRVALGTGPDGVLIFIDAARAAAVP